MPVDSDSQMQIIQNLLEQARDHFARADLYHYFEKDEDRLETALVAMNTAEDAMLALDHYQSAGIGSDEGEKYLRLYGFLQAIFIQQKSIRTLHELLVGTFSEPADTTAWWQLHELRNLTSGHPIDKGSQGRKRRTFITRVSLETDGFDYQMWNQETKSDSFEHADLMVAYAKYEQEAATFLEKVLTALSAIPDEQF
jgi:hypothetical protein